MKYGYTINNKLMANSNGKLLTVDAYDPYNPLDLPPNTIRVRTNDGQPPPDYGNYYDTATLVPGTTDVYDVYKSGNDFTSILFNAGNVVEILGGNTSNVTNMSYLFQSCNSISSVSLFDTSNVTNMNFMFGYCNSLLSVPLFDTSNVTHIEGFCKCCYSLTSVPQINVSKVTQMSWAFQDCYNVQSGALDLYRAVSSRPSSVGHSLVFRNCGINTEIGSAELAQIPSNWK